MKSRNTFGIQFVLRLPKNKKDETATVYARITVNGRRTEISLKSKVSINNWDEVKGRAKGKRQEIVKLNSHMEQGVRISEIVVLRHFWSAIRLHRNC